MNTKKIYLPKYAFLAVRIMILMTIYAIYRLAFFWYNLDLFPDISFPELLPIFWGGIRFDLVGLLYLNILYFLALLLPFYFVYKEMYQKITDAFFVIINSIGFSANNFDIVYYPFTLKRTTGTIFKIFKNEEGLFSVFLNGLFDFWESTFLFIVIVTAFIWFIKSVKIKKSTLVPQQFYVLHSILFPIIIFLMVSGIRGGFGRYTRPIAINNAGQYVSKPEQMSLVLNTPFTIIRTLRQTKFSIINDFKTREELEAVFTPVKHTNPRGPEKKKNVVILIIESLSKEHSGRLNPHLEEGNYKGYIPFLDSLMGESLYFLDAYASGRKSLDAIPAIITGIPAFKTNFAISNYSTNKIEGLGHILKKRGYELSFFHGAPNGSMGFNSFMKMAGFDKYFGKNEFNDDRYYDGTWGIYDEEFLQFFAKELNKMQEPFGSVLFTLSSHHPFEVPDKYKGKFKEGPIVLLRTVGYMDYAVKQFFKTASQMPWFKNTLFVITADHATRPYTKEYSNVIGAFSIPIIFYTPDSSLIGVENRVAHQPDIYPTILDHLNIDTPYFSFGSSLLDSTNEQSAFYYTHGVYYIHQDGYVLRYQNEKPIGLVNYKTDPYSQKDLLNINISQKELMEKKLKAIKQQFSNRMIRNEMTVQK